MLQSSEDEDVCNIKVIANQQKKKKKLEETEKKNVEIMKWKTKHTNLFQQEKEILVKFVRGENQDLLDHFRIFKIHILVCIMFFIMFYFHV